MNFKAIALQELNSFAKENPDYTLADILYSFLRKPVSGIEFTKDIRKLSDEDIYSIIEEVREEEKSENQ